MPIDLLIGQTIMDIGQTITTSAVDETVDAMLRQIVDKHWAAGQNAPTERRLVEEFSASRATVRAAIARLTQWGILMPRQGSGTVVRPAETWLIGAMPAVMRAYVATGRWIEIIDSIDDALGMRRALTMDIIDRATSRNTGRFDAARNAVTSAWKARDDVEQFLWLDHQFFGQILEQCNMHATLWLTNELRRTYVGLVGGFTASPAVPERYVELHLATLEHMERADVSAAQATFTTYLDDLDLLIINALPEALVERLSSLKGRVER